MHYLLRICIIGFFYFSTTTIFAWNMQGHQVVAQIAYDHLTPQAKEMCRRYLNFRTKKSFNAQFLFAAIWLDVIRFKKIYWYDPFHYINIPFTPDGSYLPPVEKTNVVRGIKNAISILSTKKTRVTDKKLALFILLHLMGDIHQPLHAGTRVSQHYPKGDLGGNLFPLGKNEVGHNLHQYWDNGAGFLTGRGKKNNIKDKARLLEQQWPCSEVKSNVAPEDWANTSHQIAVTVAYQLSPKATPGKVYQLKAQHLVQKQLAAAGCRLASVLNQIAQSTENT